MFNYNHPLMTFMEAVFDYVLLALLTAVCCIPVITLGSALCAFYHTGFARRRRKGTPVIATYFRSFRDSFLQGIGLGIPMTVFGGSVVALALWSFFSDTQLASTSVRAVCAVSALCIFLVLTHGACVIGCFRNSFGNNLKNALTIGISAFLRTLALFVLTVLGYYGIFLFALAAILILPVLGAVSVGLLYPVYRRYLEDAP